MPPARVVVVCVPDGPMAVRVHTDQGCLTSRLDVGQRLRQPGNADQRPAGELRQRGLVTVCWVTGELCSASRAEA